MQDPGAGLGWALFSLLIASILVGWLAQSWKRRTGAAWGCGTLLFMVVVFFFLYVVTYASSPDLYQRASGWLEIGLLTVVIVGLLMMITVATLPRLKR
jgi:hypothetical protein